MMMFMCKKLKISILSLLQCQKQKDLTVPCILTAVFIIHTEETARVTTAVHSTKLTLWCVIPRLKHRIRVELDAARAGGISDPRNTAIMRMFNLIGIGSNDGFGISNIFSVWKSHELVLPVIEESFNPESITLKLSFVPESKSTKTQILQNRPDIETDRQDAAISYITDNITVTSKEISELLGISHKISMQLLHKLMAYDFVLINIGIFTL